MLPLLKFVGHWARTSLIARIAPFYAARTFLHFRTSRVKKCRFLLTMLRTDGKNDVREIVSTGG